MTVNLQKRKRRPHAQEQWEPRTEGAPNALGGESRRMPPQIAQRRWRVRT